MIRIPFYVLFILLCPHSAIAGQFETPTDNDLKANYCLAVDNNISAFMSDENSARADMLKNNPELQHEILKPELQGAMQKNKEQQEKIAYDINRLKAYAASRFMSLDLMPLKMAYESGNNDYNKLMSFAQSPENPRGVCFDSNLAKCVHSGGTNCVATVNEQCNKLPLPPLFAEIQAKIQSCKDLSWLPF